MGFDLPGEGKLGMSITVANQVAALSKERSRQIESLLIELAVDAGGFLDMDIVERHPDGPGSFLSSEIWRVSPEGNRDLKLGEVKIVMDDKNVLRVETENFSQGIEDGAR